MTKNKMEKILISDLEEREKRIHELLREKETLNINMEACKHTSVAEKFSDVIVRFTGSWKFLFLFCTLIGSYVTINTVAILGDNYDPYPFVFLNLILACVASFQAPLIMMSQNREAKKDRIRAENDYLINLKSEIILEDLHFKIDAVQEELKEVNYTIARMQVEDKKGFI